MIASYMQHAYVNFQLPKILRKFGLDGQSAAKAEVKQLNDWICFRVLEVADLTKKEK